MVTTALTKDQVCERVKHVLAQQLNLGLDDLLPAAAIVRDLGADSLDVMEIVLNLEEEFAISVPDEDIQSLVTVQDVVDYIHRRLNQ